MVTPFFCWSQEYEDEFNGELTPMSIPSSPAFSMLGVNPEMVTRPSDVKEFKVDWRIKNYKLAPDLALEAQPLWWLLYRKKTPREMEQMGRFQRILSTMSLSFATAKIDNVNHLAWATKFNVYRELDPFADRARIKLNATSLREELKPINDEIERLEIQRLSTESAEVVDSINSQLAQLRDQRNAILEGNMTNYVEQYNEIIRDNWNMDMIDISFGRVYKYDNAAIDSLRFQNAGYSVWINGAKGVGKNALWTGMIKLDRIGVNYNYVIGGSYRFGNHKYNFFAELVRSRMNNVPENGFDEEEQFGDLRSEDLGMGWYEFADGDEGYTMWSASFGGDFKLSRNILLNFALRTQLNGDLEFRRFLPIANIVCLMN